MITLISLLMTAYTAITPVKVHVDGSGYMRFMRDDRVVYAKKATFVNIDGELGSEGAKVLPSIPVPAGTQTLKIDLQGNVDAGPNHLGRLVIALFPAGSTSSTTDSFFTFSERPTLTSPGEDAAGVIRVDSDPVADLVVSHSRIQDATTPRPPVVKTDQPLNVAIMGKGFFKVVFPDGTPKYTRDGRFTVNAIGELVTQQGYLLEPNITIPPGSTNVAVDPAGNVSATLPGSPAPNILGQVTLTTFPNPAGLANATFNYFLESSKAGAPCDVKPGAQGAGYLQSGYAEILPDSQLLSNHTAPTTTAATHTKAPTTAKNAGSQIEVIVRQHSEVIGGSFTLGDIAVISGPDEMVEAYKKVKIGETSIAGYNRVIDQRFVGLKLRGAGHPEGSYVLVVPDGADVARKTKTIAAQDIIDAAIKAAQDKIGAKVEFRVTGTVKPIVADDGEIALEASDPEQTAKGYVITVTARLGNTIVGTETLTLVPPTTVGGVKIGETVKVIFKSGAAVIEMEGKALTAGFVGQKINVSVTASPSEGGAKTTTHTGTIIEAGKVEVDL